LAINVENTVACIHDHPITLRKFGLGLMSRLNDRCLSVFRNQNVGIDYKGYSQALPKIWNSNYSGRTFLSILMSHCSNCLCCVYHAQMMVIDRCLCFSYLPLVWLHHRAYVSYVW